MFPVIFLVFLTKKYKQLSISDKVRYQIHHKTTYSYNQPVILQPHLLRLRPRCDGWQKLESFALNIEPKPQGIVDLTDLDGNVSIQLWFAQTTEKLIIDVTSEVETYKDNPFNYLLEPWALQLPIDYPSSLLSQLYPYLQLYTVIPDPIALQLAQDIIEQVEGNTLSFLSMLTQRIYQDCEQLIRENGDPWPAGITWGKKQGACRDFVVLFMDVCRAAGLAARFVSGYQEGDREQDERHLHAWVEVYIPGGGWRGFDPTHGLCVSDRHIALVASAKPSYGAPIVGATSPAKPFIETGKPLQSQMEADIKLIHL